ncbi:MAG: lysyl oxidase family protein [Saprospiraceae bacterium]
MVQIEINTDVYYYEENWMLTNLDGSIIYAAETPPDSTANSYFICVPDSQCVKFTVWDSANDGFSPDGWYRILVNNELIYYDNVFTNDVESVTFNCQVGASCTTPIFIDTGSGTTPGPGETWFSFTPTSTGSYVFSTCGAACLTKIWVYDKCAGIFLSETLLGTIFFAESGCPDGTASVQLHLEADKEYFIRTRYQIPGCSPVPILYSLLYSGPIIGCMDSLACNYDPLATVSSGVCYPFGDPNCPYAPDIEVNENALKNSLLFSDFNNSNPCLVSEGCLRGMGPRHIIEFSTMIKNIGDADYYIGSPPANITDPSNQFVYDPCHQHWHYMGYADYLLYNSSGYRVPIGSKTGFCVLDLNCNSGVNSQYDCANMGLSAGCSDTYMVGTPCQWMDITDIPPGDYTMVVRVNWDKSPDKIGRVERQYANNWAQACFSLIYDGNTPEVVFNTDSCQQFTDCLNEVFGDALPDCNGVCNGPALIGDWNLDTLRNALDVEAYLLAALSDDGLVSSCTELHEDAEINVFDAALLQECTLHADSQQHWIQRFPCQFPTGFLNTQDLVGLKPGALDTLAKTFDIEITNPLNQIIGYEFSVSNLIIESVENLVPEHHVSPQFNPTTGEILALAADESLIPKNPIPTPFLRVHYSGLTGNEVCVSGITALVNHHYQKSNATLPAPNCVPVNDVSVNESGHKSFAVFVQPNPMEESTTIFFKNPNAEPMLLQLTDWTGRQLRSFSDLRGESVTIVRDGLPEGAYIFTLQNSKKTAIGKLIIHCQ